MDPTDLEQNGKTTPGATFIGDPRPLETKIKFGADNSGFSTEMDD